jgi:DNA-binding phage protein
LREENPAGNEKVVPALPYLVPKPVSPASMAVLIKPVNEAVPEAEFSAAELKRIERDRIILESAANRGATDNEIYEILREKGFSACLKTIWTVLHSDKASKYLEVLEQAQDHDIGLLRFYALKDRENPNLKALAAVINAREKRLQRLQPAEKSRVDVNVNVANKTTVRVATEGLLAEYEQLVAASVGVEAGNLSPDYPGEPVHKAEANAKASAIPVM